MANLRGTHSCSKVVHAFLPCKDWEACHAGMQTGSPEKGTCLLHWPVAVWCMHCPPVQTCRVGGMSSRKAVPDGDCVLRGVSVSYREASVSDQDELSEGQRTSLRAAGLEDESGDADAMSTSGPASPSRNDTTSFQMMARAS